MTGFRWTIKRKLLALGAATFLPLLLLLAFWVWWEVHERTKDAEAELTLASRQAAGQVELLLGEVTRLLRVLVHNSTVQRRQIGQIEELFRQVTAEHPELEGLIAVTADGRTFASVPEPTGAPATMADRSWFKQVMATGKPVVGGFLIGRITGQPVAVVAVPLRARDGAPTGALAAGLSLRQLHLLFQSLPLAEGRAVTVIDGEGLVLSHAPKAEGWIGRRLLSAGALPAGPALVKKLAWSEGGERVVAVAPVEGTGWRVLAGFPRATREDRIWKEVWAIAFPLVGLLAVSSLIGLLIAVRVWRPLRALADAAKRLPREEEHIPIRVDSTDEVGELAEAFNVMAAQVTESRSRLEQRVAEQTALAEAGRLLTASLELPEVLQRLTELAQARLGADVVRIWLHEGLSGECRLYAQAGATRPAEAYRRRFEPGEGLVGWIMAHREPLVFADCQSDPRLTNREWIEAEGLHAFLGVPILLEETPVGVLACMSRERDKFSPEEVALARLFALPAAVAIRNARLYDEQIRLTAEAQGLVDMARVVASTLEVREMLREVCRRTALLCGADRSTIYLWDEKTARILPAVSQLASGERQETLWRRFRETRIRPLGQMPFTRRLIETRQPLTIDDARGSPLIDQAWVEAFQLKSVLGVPLVAGGRVVGAMILDTTDAVRPFTPRQTQLAVAISDLVAFTIQKALLFEEVESRLRQTQAHLEIARTLSSTLELKPLLSQIAQQAARACEMERCSIYLWEGERVVPVISQFADGRTDTALWEAFKGLGQVRVEEIPFFAETVRHREPLVIDHPAEDPRVPRTMEVFQLKALLALPLIRQEKVVGALVLDNTERTRPVTPAQVSLGMTIASQVALAVDNARLFTEAQERATELTTLQAVQNTLVFTLDLPAVLDAIAESAITVLGAQRSAVFELDSSDQRLHARATRGMRPDQPFMPMKLGQGAAGTAALRRQPVFSSDVHHQPLPMYDGLWEEAGMTLREVVRQRGYRGILAVPLISKGTVLGAICIYWDEAHAADEREVRLLTALAQQAAIAIENARLYRRAEDRAQKLKALSALTRLITSATDRKHVVQAVAEAATTLIGAKLTRVWVADPDARALRVQGDFGLDPSFLQVASDVRVLPYGAGLAGQVFESRVPEYVPDVQQDPRWLDQKLAKEAGLHAYAGIPLITEGQVVGVLAILLGEQRPFTSEEKELLDLLAGQAAIAVENARLFDEARRLTEALTEQNRQRQLLHDAQRALIAKYDLASLLQYLIGTAAELIGARYGALAVLGEDGKVMQFRTTGIDAETQERIGSLPEGRGLIGVVLRENEVLRLEDLTADPRAAGFPPHHPPMRRLLAAPIRLEDRTLGAIYLADKDESFTPEDQDLLTTLCADAAVAIENARLVQELNQALEKLKATQHQLVRSETLRAVGVLASGAAHHLNNLLAVILGNIQLLIEQVRKAEIRQPLELVEQTTRDAAEVVRRMQRFSRAEPFARLVTVDLNALAREVLELARPLWQDKAQVRGVQIEAALDPGEIPAVAGEPAALSEVFMNLLINAVEALPEGGKIAVKTWRSGPWVHCSVTDSGVGMSAHVRERALEPFFTSKGPKSTGLGLSVSYGIIQRHGGEMGIESAEGRGTTVTIRLPLAPGTAVEQPEPAASGALPLILVIEDEARVREMLVKMLSSQGHRVLQAAGGQEGLARLAAGEPVGLVLTDLGMPGMTGWEVARAVKAQWPHLPVGLITGWGEEPEASAEDRSAVDFVISKPVTLEALRKALAGRRPQPAKRDGPTSSTSECSGRSPRDLCSGE